MSTWKLTITAPLDQRGKPVWITENQRLHWAAKNGRTRHWRTLTIYAARQAKLPKGLEAAHIVATVHKPRGGRWDVSNWSPTVKAAVDGLVDYGLLADDSNRYVIGPDLRPGEPGQPRIELTITEVSTSI